MSSFSKETRLQSSVIEGHAAQLRAMALAILHEKGEEYAQVLSEAIANGMTAEDEHKRIFSILAEIGFCAVFCGAVESGGELEQSGE